MLSTLPKVLEEIIIDYKNQMDHKEKFQSTINMINDIEYTTGEYDNGELLLSSRELPSSGYMHNNHVEYYCQPFAGRPLHLNDSVPFTKNRLMIESHYSFRGDTVIYSKSIQKNDGFIKIKDHGYAFD
jgi:hypothetical protein